MAVPSSSEDTVRASQAEGKLSRPACRRRAAIIMPNRRRKQVGRRSPTMTLESVSIEYGYSDWLSAM